MAELKLPKIPAASQQAPAPSAAPARTRSVEVEPSAVITPAGGSKSDTATRGAAHPGTGGAVSARGDFYGAMMGGGRRQQSRVTSAQAAGDEVAAHQERVNKALGNGPEVDEAEKPLMSRHVLPGEGGLADDDADAESAARHRRADTRRAREEEARRQAEEEARAKQEKDAPKEKEALKEGEAHAREGEHAKTPEAAAAHREGAPHESAPHESGAHLEASPAVAAGASVRAAGKAEIKNTSAFSRIGSRLGKTANAAAHVADRVSVHANSAMLAVGAVAGAGIVYAGYQQMRREGYSNEAVSKMAGGALMTSGSVIFAGLQASWGQQFLATAVQDLALTQGANFGFRKLAERGVGRVSRFASTVGHNVSSGLGYVFASTGLERAAHSAGEALQHGAKGVAEHLGQAGGALRQGASHVAGQLGQAAHFTINALPKSVTSVGAHLVEKSADMLRSPVIRDALVKVSEKVSLSGLKIGAKAVPVLGAVVVGAIGVYATSRLALRGQYKEAASEFVASAAETVGSLAPTPALNIALSEGMRHMAAKGMNAAIGTHTEGSAMVGLAADGVALAREGVKAAQGKSEVANAVVAGTKMVAAVSTPDANGKRPSFREMERRAFSDHLSGRSPDEMLEHAVASGNAHGVQAALDKGARPSPQVLEMATDPHNRTPLPAHSVASIVASGDVKGNLSTVGPGGSSPLEQLQQPGNAMVRTQVASSLQAQGLDATAFQDPNVRRRGAGARRQPGGGTVSLTQNIPGQAQSPVHPSVNMQPTAPTV